jgi:HK97 family phage major capsid protein
LIPASVAADIISAAEQASVVLRLARHQPMPTGVVNVPFIKTLPVSGWVNGVGGRKPATSVEWSSETITPEEVAAVIAVPQATIDDAGIPIWSQVRQAVTDAVSFSIDSAVLFGDNAPPTFLAGGIAGQAIAAGNTAHTPTTDPPDVVSAVNAAMADVEDAGIEVTGHAADISIRSKLRGLRDENGQPLFVPNLGADAYSTLYGLPIAFSSSGAFDTDIADLITGNWNYLIVGVRRDMTVETSTEGVITDDTGKVLVNAFQDDQVLMRVHMRLGYVLGKPVTRRAGGPAFPFGLVDSAPAGP